MPLWIIYHPQGTFEEEETKRGLANDITDFYTALGLPKFYVAINFVKLPGGDMWVGGESRAQKPYIRITIDHVAVHHDPGDDARHRRTVTTFDNILKPYVANKGWDWEFHIDETDKRLWGVNGFIPPEFNSEATKLWFRENKPVPY